MSIKNMILEISKKVVGASVIMTLLVVMGYSTLEPQVVKAVTDQVVITLNVTQGITITSPPDSSMSTAISVSQNTAVGTTTWNVKTNDANGYTLALAASTVPAMQQTSTTTVADYGQTTPNTWSVSNAAAFGYSAFGNDTPTGTWGTDTDCYGASNNSISTGLKYRGFATTTGTNVASKTATTTSSGTDTNICYAVEQNNFYIPSGTYTASITATALGN